MEFSNFRSSAVGLPKKSEPEAELSLDIKAIEEFLQTNPEINQPPSEQSLREVKREAKKRKLFKFLRRRRSK
jgi:hypothetical protein